MENLIPQFPTKFWAKQYSKQIEAELFSKHKLWVILNSSKWTINDIINDFKIREMVRVCYKDTLEFERKIEARNMKLYQEFLLWIEKYK